jgi:hypothetical protein
VPDVGRHSTIIIEPPAPVEPAEPAADVWGGYADKGTDLERWLEELRPNNPPVMEL